MTSHSRWIPELLCIALATQAVVYSTTSAHEDLFERRAEVTVEPGVNDGVEEAVGVAEPQQETVETVRDARLDVFAPRFDEGEQEEWKPTGCECSHYDAESLGCLAIV